MNNIKLLIDTGATKSFIDPDIAETFFPHTIRDDPFIVSNTFSTSAHKYSAYMEIPDFFNRPNEHMKFHLFKFHSIFKGLIGLDNLELLNATLDFKNKVLITPNCKVKIHFQNIPQRQINSYSLEPRTEQIIKIRTTVKNGDIIVPHINSHGCQIPECLTVAKNHEAFVSITNKNEHVSEVDFSDPIETELLTTQPMSPLEFQRISFLQNNFNNFELSENKPFKVNIRTDHMNSEEKYHIEKLINEYSDIFHSENMPLTFTNAVKHKIKTTDELPVYSKSYRYPFIHKKEVQEQIDKMLKQKIIQPSSSNYCSPIWVVPKKLDASGKQKYRIVLDYRKLNEKSIRDQYPLPNISDILDKLGKCQYFSTLDLASGFHQIEMDPEDVKKTAFSVENGLYEFLRMPFGLRNAPATFQRLMDNILRGIQNERCLVYLDDIIIFSVSLEEHLLNLREVFDRLRATNFKIQLDKSEFLRKEVAYLGHIITPTGIKPNPDKIIAIKNYPIPKTSKQLKGFLGLLGYYRKFVNRFSDLTKPLTKCLKKGASITHNKEFVDCFESCKNLLMNEPILQYPDFEKTFNLTTDASNVAIGAVLSQGSIGNDLPIAYASRTLNESEQNYSTIEKELLAIVYAVKYFRPYLFGRHFNVITDHKPLEWLFSLKEPNSKLIRWKLKLQEYDYTIFYKKGKLNQNADALSRIEIHFNETNDNSNIDFTDKEIENVINEIEQYAVTNENINDDDINSIIANIDEQSHMNIDIDDEDDQTQHSNTEYPNLEIPIAIQELNKAQNQIEIQLVNHSPNKPKIIKPFPNKQRIIAQISKNNTEHEIVQFVKEYCVPKVTYHLYFLPQEFYEEFCRIVQRNFKWPCYKFICTVIKLIDVEEDEISQVIQNYHEGKSNHRGISETETRIKLRYYWPNMRSSIQTYINSCDLCQRAKFERNPVKIGISLTPTATKPFEMIHIDTLKIQKEPYLTIIDAFSKYAQIYHLKSQNSIDIVQNLLKFFSYLGIPKTIICDNGTEFKNSNVIELLELHKIKVHFITPENPSSNGMIERFHGTLLEHLRLLNEQHPKENMETKILYAILAYNNTIHSTTNKKPINIISGHLDVDDPFDIDCQKIIMNDYVQDHKNKTEIMYRELNKRLQERKERVVEKTNLNEDIIGDQIPEFVYPKETRRKTKLDNRFRQKIAVKAIDKDKRIISAPNRNYHIRNIQRPKKIDKEKLLQVRPDVDIAIPSGSRSTI